MHLHTRSAASAMLLLALLSGCAAPSLRVGVSSTANINMNEFDEPLPVVVRVYQLSASQRFEAATFEQLWKNDFAALGETLVMKEELVINPAAQTRLEMPRHDQANFLAAIAIFRSPSEDSWKSVQPLPNNFLTKRFSRNAKVSLRGSVIALED